MRIAGAKQRYLAGELHRNQRLFFSAVGRTQCSLDATKVASAEVSGLTTLDDLCG